MTATETDEAPRFDERLIPAGTNARFALVVVLALLSSAEMVLQFMLSFSGERIARCELAAGIDVFRVSPDASVALARLTQAAAYTNCVSRLVAPPPWWLPAGWPFLVLVVAVAIFYASWWWKTRGSRVIPIEAFDAPVNGFVLSKEVHALAREAGVSAGVTCVVKVTSMASSAAALGSNRRPVLCLNLGLVTERLRNAADGAADPKFRAVLLHEFAHIRSGDVTAARGTMAVWRAFLIVALVPYLIISATTVAYGAVVPGGLGEAGIAGQRDLLVTLVLACLGYLARTDVLRNREIYADRDAVDYGADKACWSRPEKGIPSTTGRAFAELWRSHPSWSLRAWSLDNRAAIFTVRAVPVFLTGVAAALIDSDFHYADQVYSQIYSQGGTWIGSPWMSQGAGALSAAVVSLIVGVALWRLVVYSRQAGEAGEETAAATGLRVGLWLGAGIIAGNLVSGQDTIGQLVPSRPEVLLLVLAAGAGYGWWTVQCAGAWVTKWRGRIPGRAMMASLAGGFLILSWWFTWWASSGSSFSTGISFSPGGYRNFLVQDWGPALHPTLLTVVTWLQLPLGELVYPPAVLLAVGAAWIVPLLAWARSSRTAADSLPSLRMPVAWAAAGAVATWVCVAWAQAYMHETQPPQPPLHGLYKLTYAWLLVGAQAVPAAAVAVAVGLRRGRLRLLVTLIATAVTVLAGVAGTFLLMSVDGCIRPLATLETSCSWRPGLMEATYSTQVDTVAVLTALITFAACACALLRPAVRQDYRAGWAGTAESRDETGTGAQTSSRGRARSRSRRLVLTGTAAAVALGVALADIVIQFPQESRQPSPSTQATVQELLKSSLPAGTPATLPPQVARVEVQDWSQLGGSALLRRLQTDDQKIFENLKAGLAHWHAYTVRAFLAIKPVCADIVAVSRQSSDYFLIPDVQARPWWSTFVSASGDGGRGCESAISLLQHDIAHQRAGQLHGFWTALGRDLAKIGIADTDSVKIETRIRAIEAAGGAALSAGPGPLGILPVPLGATPWAVNTGAPMSRDAYVRAFYLRSAWTYGENELVRYGFVSGAQEGWNYSDNTAEAISIARFSGSGGATREFDSVIASFRRDPGPGAVLADHADGGIGTVNPTVDNAGDVTTKMAARLGDDLIEVEVFTPRPDPADAKALLRRQYSSLEKTGA